MYIYRIFVLLWVIYNRFVAVREQVLTLGRPGSWPQIAVAVRSKALASERERARSQLIHNYYTSLYIQSRSAMLIGDIR